MPLICGLCSFQYLVPFLYATGIHFFINSTSTQYTVHTYDLSITFIRNQYKIYQIVPFTLRYHVSINTVETKRRQP